MKTISVVVPCYNEEENVEALADGLRNLFKKDLQNYEYEIIFIDNDSNDNTRDSVWMTRELRGFLMLKILGSLIPRTMLCCNPLETVPFSWRRIFRTLWIWSPSL